jgi:hypothetical protein
MADNLATFMCRSSRNSGYPNLLEPSGHVKGCTAIALRFKTIEYVTYVYFIFLCFYFRSGDQQMLATPLFEE